LSTQQHNILNICQS